jgi:hypothetical protein
MEHLRLLQDWYSAHCNGDWEHQYGVRLETLDNPGWTLEIDLWGTSAEDRTLDPVKIERMENDWIHYRVADKKFRAAMGPQNLAEGIEVFFRWFEDSNLMH